MANLHDRHDRCFLIDDEKDSPTDFLFPRLERHLPECQLRLPPAVFGSETEPFGTTFQLPDGLLQFREPTISQFNATVTFVFFLPGNLIFDALLRFGEKGDTIAHRERN